MKEKKALDAKTVAVVELSEEEAKMNGAPEGQLFTVVLQERDELEPFSAPTAPATGSEDSKIEPSPASLEANAAMAKVMRQLNDKGGSLLAWHLQFEACTNIRRFAVHHPSSLEPGQTVEGDDDGAARLAKIVAFAVTAAKSARSSVQRNGILALQDLVGAATVADQLAAEKSTTMVSAIATVLVECCASNQPKIIRATAASALGTVAECESPLAEAMAQALGTSGGHKNKDVATQALLHTERCIKKVPDDTLKAKDLKLLIAVLHAGLLAKAPEARSASTMALRHLATKQAKQMGDGGFKVCGMFSQA